MRNLAPATRQAAIDWLGGVIPSHKGAEDMHGPSLLPSGLALVAMLCAAAPVACHPTAWADTVSVLTAGFEKTPGNDPSRPDSGRIYIGPDGSWRIDYWSPLRQVMVATDTVTTVLYPDEERALVIRSRQMEPPSLLFFVVHVLRTNEELTAAGFEVAGFAVRGDTSITSWARSASSEEPGRPQLRIWRRGASVVRLEVGVSGEVKREYVVEETVAVGSSILPRTVRCEEWGPAGHSIARIRYSDVRVTRERRGEVFGTGVPVGYGIESRRW